MSRAVTLTSRSNGRRSCRSSARFGSSGRDVVFYSDANLGFLLYWFRCWIGVPYRLLFSNGGPCRPPFVRLDFVHQVNPVQLEEAVRAGEPAAKHIMIPYGLDVGAPPGDLNDAARRALRERLSLPADRTVVLSVGWISRTHKRMHYVVEEVARLPAPRPFLMLLGAMDRGSEDIVRLAQERLGPGGFAARSVPYHDVAPYYAAADCFVLASLAEGFGRVFLEALAYGLPVIAHRHPVMEYVLGEHGVLADLSVPGTLAHHLLECSVASGGRVRHVAAVGRRPAPLWLGRPGAGLSTNVRACGACSPAGCSAAADTTPGTWSALARTGATMTLDFELAASPVPGSPCSRLQPLPR